MKKHGAIRNRFTGEAIIPAGKYGESLGGADLGGADLRGADLRGANLRGANLRGADLGGADLRRTDLRGANLRRTDLRRTDLRDADLRGANLDHSSWPLWCGSFDVKVSMRHVYQLCYHICRLQCDTKTFRVIKAWLKPYANRFHRIGMDVDKIK